jgi:hypothetical protein
MKTRNLYALFSACLCLARTVAPSLFAQTKYTAIEIPTGVAGNATHAGWGFGSDFYVNQPVTIWQLGIFDDLSDGIQGDVVLTAQLYARNGSSGTLLETVNFDFASPGTLSGGGRFKALQTPVTLLPGSYTVMAYGFNHTNRLGQINRAPYTNDIPWTLNNGGGLLRFEKGRHGLATPGQFPHGVNTNHADFYAFGSFVYSAGTLPTPSYAADYAALISGVTQFPFTGQRRAGSIAVFNQNSFPVLVQPDGNRLVIEAAGKYNDDPNGGRCVIFSQSEFGRTGGDARGTMFENAVRWASRKAAPSQTVVCMGPALNTNYFSSRGYQVQLLSSNDLDSATNSLPACDVLVLNWNAPFGPAMRTLIRDFTAQGGGLVVTMMPWLQLHGGIQEQFGQVNDLLQPYGLAYRPSTMYPAELGFTNIVAQAYPTYFSAYPAATLLGQDRLGRIHMTSLEKVIALNTINSAINARPDVMGDLTTLSSGGTLGSALQSVNASSFSDFVVLTGSQALTNKLGQWMQVGTDLICTNRRGAVDYEFNTSQADLFKLQIIGTQAQPRSLANDFDLVLSMDGVGLKHHHLKASYGVDGTVECFTPFLPAGTHTLRIYWDNAASYTSLRLKEIHVQTGAGPDDDGNGIKDWVDSLVHSQSGLDFTNATLNSFVSPFCVEGSDPYLSLMQFNVQGSQGQTPQIWPAPNNRWFANVALPGDQNTPLVFNVAFQNGAVSQWRQIQWKPINLLTTTNVNWTIRAGDSLLLGAKPLQGTNAPVCLTVGTNQRNTTANNPIPIRFVNPGTFTVTGTYTGAVVRSGSITVNVVGYQFPNNPDAWALNERLWDLTNMPASVTLETDNRMVFEQVSALPDGQRVGLITDQNEPRLALARLGTNGPVLDLARVNGFNFYWGGKTYTKVLQTYEDGSQLVEMLLVMSPMPADISVQMEVNAGGIMFEDGTAKKMLTAADFDSLGRSFVRFIRPASARTSVCHSIKLFQGQAFVGQVL